MTRLKFDSGLWRRNTVIRLCIHVHLRIVFLTWARSWGILFYKEGLDSFIRTTTHEIIPGLYAFFLFPFLFLDTAEGARRGHVRHKD